MSLDYYCDNDECGYDRSTSWWLEPSVSTCPKCKTGRLMLDGRPWVPRHQQLLDAIPEVVEVLEAVHVELTDPHRYGQHRDNPLPTRVRAALAKLRGEEPTTTHQQMLDAIPEVVEVLEASREAHSYAYLSATDTEVGEEAQKAIEKITGVLAKLRGEQPTTTRKDYLELRRNPDGTLDEVVGRGFFHLEQMDMHTWFLDLGGAKFHLRVTKICEVEPFEVERDGKVVAT